METFSTLLAIYAGNSPVPGEFPAQRPVTRSFDVIFDLRMNKRLRKQSWGWWFETLSRPLWRHCNDIMLRPEHKHGHLWTISFLNAFCSNNICIVGQFLLSYKRKEAVNNKWEIHQLASRQIGNKPLFKALTTKKNNSASLWDEVISRFFQCHRNWMQNPETPCYVYILLWYEMENCFQIYENVETIM